MSTLRIIAWSATIIFTLLFIFRWVRLFSIETPGSSMGYATPYVLGLFLGNAIIPAILWIAVHFREGKKK
jgi:hypothetical protein